MRPAVAPHPQVGMDTGFVADSINATTGRMAYRGRPMNRAARIASKALAGQVRRLSSLCPCSASRPRTLVLQPSYGRRELNPCMCGAA